MRIIKESVFLIEDKVVKFGNQVNPNYGWCVILAGGSGIGKGDMFNKKVMINAKKFDVDDIKQFFIKMSDLDGDTITTADGEVHDMPDDVVKNPTFSNPAFTSYIHKLSKPLVGKVKNKLFNTLRNAHPDRLPNICFDITGKDITDINQILEVVKPLGYKTSLVWLVGDVDIAIEQNKKRSRTVDEDLLKDIHLNVMLTMGQLYRDHSVLNLVDEAWVVLYLKYNYRDRNDLLRYMRSSNVLKIEDSSSASELTSQIRDIVKNNITKLEKIIDED